MKISLYQVFVRECNSKRKPVSPYNPKLEKDFNILKDSMQYLIYIFHYIDPSPLNNM
jgi:hypothetical protein